MHELSSPSCHTPRPGFGGRTVCPYHQKRCSRVDCLAPSHGKMPPRIRFGYCVPYEISAITLLVCQDLSPDPFLLLSDPFLLLSSTTDERTHPGDGNEAKRKTPSRFHFSGIPFPSRFPFHLGGNEKSGFVSIPVSVRFLFPRYRCETRNEVDLLCFISARLGLLTLPIYGSRLRCVRSRFRQSTSPPGARCSPHVICGNGCPSSKRL